MRALPLPWVGAADRSLAENFRTDAESCNLQDARLRAGGAFPLKDAETNIINQENSREHAVANSCMRPSGGNATPAGASIAAAVALSLRAGQYEQHIRCARGAMLTIVLPARNEAAALADLLPRLKAAQPGAEIIVVDDGSADETVRLCQDNGVRVVSQPYSMGNGAAIKRGTRAATGDILVFMDADGQHDPLLIDRLLARLDEGMDMVVGARDWSGQAGVSRGIANALYNWLASRITGFEVKDLTSGFRAVRADKFSEFLYLLPNGFSYPTTSTMAFFRSAYAVAYEPIPVAQRIGKSHIRPLRDGVRFLLIIFKIATLYSPLKLFAPTSAIFFLLGIGYYAYTYLTVHRFTNMSMLLFSAAVIVFLIGLVSEQITSLIYKK